MANRLTIHDIKYRTQETSPYFFCRDTMKYFGQRMKDFKVRKLDDGRYEFSAIRKLNGKPCGKTRAIFNPITNRIEKAD